MKSFWMRRPEIGSVTLSIVVSGFLLLTANQTFWLKAFRDFANSIHFAMFALSLALIFTSLFVAVSVKYLTKPIFIFLLLSAAPAAYFTDTFGTIINSGMIENAATTTSSEAKHLITFDFCWHLVLFGIVPALVVAWVKIRHQNFGQKLSRNTMVIVAMLLISSGLVYAQMGQVIVTLRQDHALMETLNPAGPVSAAFNYAFAAAEDATIVRQSLGMDARRGDLASASPKPVVTIVVAGETARAMNFSLNGYTRDTNPELEKLDVINYPHATSCGTDTAESLPCMFSNLTRQDFSKRKAKGRESLMDVIRHSGDAAYWWDNNTGSKGIADLINFSSVTGDHDPAQCANGECRDGIFLKQLDRLIGSTPKDTVIVLHQIGSHGPAYYLRYSDAFRKFTPDCRTPQITDCPLDQVVNAYDNTILYTDHILASVIDILKKHQDHISGAMIYMSDHGESLGENGLFLHGAPYSIAPPQQTHIPMIAWFSDDYQKRMGLDRSCIVKNAANAYSHDNLFHTVLGMMDIRTSVYRPELDIYHSCRIVRQG